MISSAVIKGVLFCTLLVLSPLFAWADSLVGRVIKVSDGDTISIIDDARQQHRIRLSGIDAPEKKQAFGQRSKESLSSLVAGKRVSIDWNKRDRYSRIVGKVLLEGKDINLLQIERGFAWHYKAYQDEQELSDRAIYANAEYEAQRSKRGLWVDDHPMAPWEFRRTRNLKHSIYELHSKLTR